MSLTPQPCPISKGKFGRAAETMEMYMSNFTYEAVNAGGVKMAGTLNVTDQSEALRRVKEMGLFPTRIAETKRLRRKDPAVRRRGKPFSLAIPIFGERVKPAALAVFTRQLATLIEAGMPLLRGLRILREQEEKAALKNMLDHLASTIETGGSLSDAMATRPKTFSPLYINMVKAGELGGALDVSLRRLAEFMEKAQKIKSKIKAAMFYPAAVMTVAVAILGVLLVFVVPRFEQVFGSLMGGQQLPAFTRLVLGISYAAKTHFLSGLAGAIVLGVLFYISIQTEAGRRLFDQIKLKMPILGPVFRKVAVSRFARTLGTLLTSGVPVLQALAIVKETTGNVIVGSVVSAVHDSVKEGDTMSAPLRGSRVFPAMVAGMVDIGEQTGALPDMLMKIGDNYDDEVDNAVSAMTSLLEPIMIVLLAVVVGSIVIAMFLPILRVITIGIGGPGGE